jgi:intracellular multiplication protein IcmJ
MMSDSGKYYTITLQATPNAWRLYASRQADPLFQEYAKRVFERDQYTCMFCGFRAIAYQEVINLDGNYTNNKLENLVTACCFCSQCFFLESVGVGGYGGGTLIYLPELTQAELNSLCHVLFCAINNDTGYKINAQTIYLNLKMRAQDIENKFGEGSSDPSTFGHLLIDTNASALQSYTDLMSGIRLLPSRAKFRQQIETWAINALKEMENAS